tara:strand:+ start:944 stop:1198 length:255 start_codon:yes stop_codon:yes gene_type:complete
MTSDFLIIEALTKTDKDEVKSLISKEVKSMISKEISDAVSIELAKELKSPAVKQDIGDITKKVLKRLYKDLSLQHPYIIDRIKI